MAKSPKPETSTDYEGLSILSKPSDDKAHPEHFFVYDRERQLNVKPMFTRLQAVRFIENYNSSNEFFSRVERESLAAADEIPRERSKLVHEFVERARARGIEPGTHGVPLPL